MADKRRFVVLLGVAATAGALFLLSFHHPSTAEPPVIRGRAPGLELHFERTPGVPFKAGENVTPGESIGVTYRNLGNESLWAFVFAYDSLGNLYWLEPHHTSGTRIEDLSVGLAPTTKERNVGGSARLDNLPPGPLTVFALVTPGIMTASRIERLDPAERNAASLRNRFPDGAVFELPLTFVP